jgi:hypothetical protein
MPHLKKITPYLIPSIADVIFIAIFIYLSFAINGNLLSDCDTAYHICTGDYIVENLSIPNQDIFSFHKPPLAWTAHEWLSEVIMALIHHFSGLTGIVISFSFVIALIYYLLFKIIQTYNDNIITTSVIVLLVLTASQIHWLARPHIFSMLLILIWYFLLDTYQKTGQIKYLYFLPILMVFWVNLHGGFMAGFMLICIYLIANIIYFFISQGDEKKKYLEKNKHLLVIAFICLAVSLLNPFTYHILIFPFKLVSQKFIMDNIAEYLPPNFHSVYIMPFEILLILVLTTTFISKLRLRLNEIGLFLLFLHMSLYSVRYIPLFAIMMAPILAKQVKYITEQMNNKFILFFNKRSENISKIDSQTKGFLWPAMAIFIVFLLAGNNIISHTFDEQKKPVAATEFLLREPIQGNMFNNAEFGDYIIYRAYPQYKVFFDGRNDMYGVEIFKEYCKITDFKPGWEKIIERYNIDWIIYNADSILSRFLIQNENWHLIYADKVANIFVKDIPSNQYLIAKYNDVKPVILEDDNEKG